MRDKRGGERNERRKEERRKEKMWRGYRGEGRGKGVEEDREGKKRRGGRVRSLGFRV